MPLLVLCTIVHFYTSAHDRDHGAQRAGSGVRGRLGLMRTA